MQLEIIRLQKQIKRLEVCVAFLGIAVLALTATAFDAAESHNQVLRARGLIIEDNDGRERILIGSPIPTAKNRVRTDLERVKGTWAKRFPSSEKYIETYKTYQNEMNGILLLDANGLDRVALRDPVPHPNSVRSIAPSICSLPDVADEFGLRGSGLLQAS